MTREEAIAAMEALQKLSCGYLPGGACDCKYGLKPEILKCENYGRSVSRPMDERTGCPELRDMKALLEAMSDEDFERFLGMSNGMIFAEKEVDDQKSDGLTDLERRLGEFKDLVRIQCSTGNFDYDGYMHGMANGMLLAEAVLEGREPEYKVAPERWLSKQAQFESENVRVLTGLKQELEKIRAEYRCHPENFEDMSFAATVGVLESILNKYGAEEKKVIEFSEPVELPDGSGVMTGKFPLPKDHWIYEDSGEPPMPMKMGVGDPVRKKMTEQVRAAAQFALRCATMSGEDMDFDPDAVIQELIVGLFGYHTKDGSEGGELIPKCPNCRAWLTQPEGDESRELHCEACGYEEDF